MAIATADVDLARQLFAPTATLRSVVRLDDPVSGATRQRLDERDLDAFLAGLASLKPGQAEERVGAYVVQRDGDLATTWVPYAFYVDGQRSHCGTNALTLVRRPNGRWLIADVTDTRRNGDCPDLGGEGSGESPELAAAELDTLMDRWHRAAATADSAAFFGAMSADGVYLGTDATERWLRDSMAHWAAPYFRREVAWAFAPRERHWSFGADGRVAWFDEHLDSWMGVVRGSGVLTKVDDPAPGRPAWELRHYNLALAVPNDRMDAVRVAIDSTAVPRG